MRRLLKYLLLFSIVFYCVVSCAPQDKLGRLLEKHPELMKVDTICKLISLKDTVFIEADSEQISFPISMFSEPNNCDVRGSATLTVETERSFATLSNIKGDSLTLRVTTKRDTFVIHVIDTINIPTVEYTTRTETIKVLPKWYETARFGFFSCLFLILLLVVLFWLLRNKNY